MPSRIQDSPEVQDLDEFHQLVQDLSAILGPSSGIDSEDVDPNGLKELMRQYTSNTDHWSKYALGDPSRPYTRNLVDSGNGKSNLVRSPAVSGSGRY